MKKTLLALCCAAVAMTASADKVTFVPQLGGYHPAAEDGESVVIPITWSGQTLYCDAFNLYIDGGSRVIKDGALYIASSASKQAYVDIRPCAGITIKKVEFRMYPNAQSATFKTSFDNTSLDETGIIQRWTGTCVGNDALNNRLKFDLHKDGEAPVSTERVRLHAITVEYEGTVGRCLAPKANVNDVVTSNAITLTCDEPGATIWYSTNVNATYYVYDQQPDTLFEKYDGQPIVISQVTKLNAFATVDGKKKSGLYYNWIVPGPEESHHAVFNFLNPRELTPALAVEPLVPSTLILANASQGMTFNDNGVNLAFRSTASNATNGIRFMSTDAYGCMGEVRIAARNGNKNNNKLDITTENPENTICQITIIGSDINGNFAAAQQLVGLNEETKKYVLLDDSYTFPGNIDYDNVESSNYKTTVFKPTSEFPSAARPLVQTWTLGEDYEGEDPVTRVVFDMLNESSTARFNEVHVFYWGDAPEGGNTGVNGIVADKVDENAPVEYYNLQGLRVANPQGGIFIRRQGSKVSKIYVK